jgi:hypothetical protein
MLYTGLPRSMTTLCPACSAPLPSSAMMPLGSAVCPACETTCVLAYPLHVIWIVVSAVISYRMTLRTGFREWPFLLCWVVLTPIVQAALLRALGQLFPLPLRVVPEPFDHVNIHTAGEESDLRRERLKRLADSIDPTHDE